MTTYYGQQFTLLNSAILDVVKFTMGIESIRMGPINEPDLKPNNRFLPAYVS